MFRHAQRFNSVTQKWEPVSARELTEADRNELYRCESCLAEASLVIGTDRENHFRSTCHHADCPVASEHSRVLRLKAGTAIDIDAILEYEDRPIIKKPKDPTPDPGTGAPNDPQSDDNDDDYRLVPDGLLYIRSASGMYRALAEKQGHDYIDDVTDQEVNSIFLCRETLRRFKSNWGDAAKLVVTKRCDPKKLKAKIPCPNRYVILRDAYSTDDEDAIYFIVRMAHPDHDRVFKDRLFGHTQINDDGTKVNGIGRDKHRNIVIFAKWRKIKHTHYRVYMAELNSRSVAYVNAPDTL